MLLKYLFAAALPLFAQVQLRQEGRTVVEQLAREGPMQVNPEEVIDGGFLTLYGKRFGAFYRTPHANVAYTLDGDIGARAALAGERSGGANAAKSRIEKRFGKTIIGDYSEKELAGIERYLKSFNYELPEDPAERHVSAGEAYARRLALDQFAREAAAYAQKQYVRIAPVCGERSFVRAIVLSEYPDFREFGVSTPETHDEFVARATRFGFALRESDARAGKVHLDQLEEIYAKSSGIPRSEVALSLAPCAVESNLNDLLEKYK